MRRTGGLLLCSGRFGRLLASTLLKRARMDGYAVIFVLRRAIVTGAVTISVILFAFNLPTLER